jgi:hypothetical protein
MVNSTIKMIMVYAGVCCGILLTLYGLRTINYYGVINHDLYILGDTNTLVLAFVLISVANILQISILMLITNLFRKNIGSFFLTLYGNFIVGFLFSLMYLLGSELLIPLTKNTFSFVGSYWFVLIVLPVIVFVPLVFIDYLLLYKRRRK